MRTKSRCIEEVGTTGSTVPKRIVSTGVSHVRLLISHVFSHIRRGPSSIGSVQEVVSCCLPAAVGLLRTCRRLSRRPMRKRGVVSSGGRVRSAVSALGLTFRGLLSDLFRSAT